MWNSLEKLTKLFRANDSKTKAKPGTTYQVRPPIPVGIPEGYVMLKRTPHSNLIQIHYPDGSFTNWVYGKDTQSQWIKMGMNPFKIDQICNFLYNFNKVIVKLKIDEPWAESD